jgi:polyisoprenoid-binding protein YceI
VKRGITKTLPLLFSALLLLSSLAAAEPVVYKVDPDHSGVLFTIRHFVANVPGSFRDFDGVVKLDMQRPAASSVEFTVRAASIDTGNNDRDEHLRSADFFDVDKFPTLTFASVEVKAKSQDTLEVAGDLTIHGVTRRVTIPVSVLGTVRTPNAEKAGFEAIFTVNRKDFGLTWNRVLDAGGAVLGDQVKITIEVEGSRQIVPAS